MSIIRIGGLSAAIFAGAMAATTASAAVLEITVTNEQASDGLFLTPVYFGFHDGSFDAFDVGDPASAGVQLLAEEGNFGAVRGEREAAAPTSQGAAAFGPAGFGSVDGQPPVLDPGETATFTINVDTANRFMTFLSMVIPSNDAFIGNDNPFAYELFTADGDFTGIAPIEVTLDEIWDAGTEVNNNLGAAFNAAGGERVDEGDVISLLGDGIAGLYGQRTAAGTVTGQSFNSLVATISVAAVPLPAGLPLLALGVAGLVGLRRKAR